MSLGRSGVQILAKYLPLGLFSPFRCHESEWMPPENVKKKKVFNLLHISIIYAQQPQNASGMHPFSLWLSETNDLDRFATNKAEKIECFRSGMKTNNNYSTRAETANQKIMKNMLPPLPAQLMINTMLSSHLPQRYARFICLVHTMRCWFFA